MVASLDRTLGSVSLVSVPRDLVDVPLGNGDVYGPKLNSLLGYAERHPEEFPDGPVRTLENAVGALLGIRIHYYATLDFNGFADLVDAVGGVVVNVKKGFEDPTYDGYGLDGRGWSIEPGRHLLDGPNALAYARSRKALGESDFTRQDRQQQILVALRSRILSGGSLFFQLPGLLDTLGAMVRTDLPPDRLPELAALADTAERDEIVRVVIQRPLIRPTKNRYGAVQEPDLDAIRGMAAVVLPPPGTPASPWSPDEGSTAAEASPVP
jgi:LCP family protein required for cell wall assembly